MVKYKLLEIADLENLRDEFVDYLAANGISVDYWEKIKVTSPEKAERVLELFSDVIFESVLRRIEFMDFVIEDEIHAYHCMPEKISLVGIKSEDNQVNFLEDDINDYLLKGGDKLKIFTSSKEYSKSREMELFEMMERGCMISKGELFKTISLGL